MPLYEYQCESCDKRFELIRKFSDPPLTECPTCGGPVRKLVSSPAFQFKGSGFYITDYGRKDSGSDKDSGSYKDSGSDKDSGAGKESGAAKSDDKPAAASSSGDTKSAETKSGSAGATSAAPEKTAPASKPDSSKS